MAREVEKKYRVVNLPNELDPGVRIFQGYIDFRNNDLLKQTIKQYFGDQIDLDNIKEARIRLSDDGENPQYYLTLKSDGTISRDEFNTEITEEEFSQLREGVDLGEIEKVRHDIPFDGGFKGELDVYSGRLDGLVVVEFEFDPEQHDESLIDSAARSVDSGAEDVTKVKSFKNRELAMTHSLEELETRVAEELSEIKTEGGQEPGRRI